MPLVPPTRAKVDAMVAASGRAADDVIGVFAPGMGIGTVEKIAANAVMAGAPPNTMPVILAMAECVLDDTIGLRTFAMSTGPQAPIVMVSGPIADEIGMNRGVCALGPGSVSSVNVAIGRTLRLIMMNVGHSYPGISDMDTIGSSMKFSACVAENEDRNPWAPFRVQEGYGVGESTVTVNVPYGVCELFDFQNHDPELLVESFATVTRNVAGSPSPGVWLVKEPADPSAGYPFNGVYHNLIMMCPEHAEVFANVGLDDRRHQAGAAPPQPAAVPHRDGEQADAAVRGVAPRAAPPARRSRRRGRPLPERRVLPGVRRRRGRRAQPLLPRRHGLGDEARLTLLRTT